MPQSSTMSSKWMLLLTPLLAAGLSVVASTAVAAQTPLLFHVGGGAIMPSGDFGTYANPGWSGFAGVSKPLASRPELSLQATAFYGHAAHDGDAGDATNIPGVGVGISCQLGDAKMSARPYVGALLGFLQHRYSAGSPGYPSESETKLFVGPGGGVSFGRMFVDVRYMASDGTSFIPISLGFRLGAAPPTK
jgi:hypothetical protein